MRAGLVIGLVVLVGCGGEAAEVDGSRSPAPGVTGGDAGAPADIAATGGDAPAPASGGSLPADPTGGAPTASGGAGSGAPGGAVGTGGAGTGSGGLVTGATGGSEDRGGEGGALPLGEGGAHAGSVTGGQGDAGAEATGGSAEGGATSSGGTPSADTPCTLRCVTIERRVGVPDERTESSEEYATCRISTIPVQSYVFRQCTQGPEYSSLRQCVIDDAPIDDECAPGPPLECEAGSRRCDGSAVSVCRFDADLTTSWHTEDACDPDLGCSDGYCNECVPGSSHCVDTDDGPSRVVLAWCVSEGAGYYDTTATCPSGTSCVLVDDPAAPLVRGVCEAW